MDSVRLHPGRDIMNPGNGRCLAVRFPLRSPSRRRPMLGTRAALECKGASMSTNRKKDKDTSVTLMMRVQEDPADPRAWDEFVERYQPMIRAWCLRWGSQPSDADDVAQQVLLKLL